MLTTLPVLKGKECMYKEKKTSKEKKFLIAVGVLLLVFTLVKGGEAQQWGRWNNHPRFYAGGYGNQNFQGYFYRSNVYIDYAGGYRWYNDPFYSAYLGGVYNNNRSRYHYGK